MPCVFGGGGGGQEAGQPGEGGHGLGFSLGFKGLSLGFVGFSLGFVGFRV